MKKRIYISFLLIVFVTSVSNAQFRRGYRGFSSQSNLEIGIGIGPTWYQGDLCMGLITIEKTKLNIGAFVRTKPFERLAFRAGINYGRIAGSDAAWGKYYSKSDNVGGFTSVKQEQYYQRYKRNLSFYSNIFEINGMAELNLYHPRSKRVTGSPLPYAVLGVSYFHFNPKTIDRHGNLVKLRNIPTELYKSYKIWQFSIPLGLGVKFYSNRNWYITVEAVYRKTFTDWLDDVHHNYAGPKAAGNIALQQLSDRSGEIDPAWGKNWDKVTLDPNNYLRGNPNNNDAYIFTMITFNKMLSNYTTCTNF